MPVWNTIHKACQF